MHPRLSLAALVFVCTCAAAQQTPPAPVLQVQEFAPADPRKNQKVERMHIEDSAVVIDEVRYGGQTQSITVQPKAGAPEYEIVPMDMARTRPGDHRDGLSNANGQRVWNVLKF